MATQFCKNCNSVIDKKAAICPACGVKVKKPFYKRVWFIALVVIVAIAVIANMGGEKDQSKLEKSDTVQYSHEIQPTKAPVREESSEVTQEQAVQETQNLVDGMRPEFKETMDSYEAFMKDYCDFMKKYESSTDVLSLMTDYYKMMDEYEKFAKKIEEIDEQELNAAELQYYTQVTARVSAMLIEVAY